jgi:hypothetical protein
MTTLFAPLALAVTVVATLYAFQLRRKRTREALLKQLELRPNCLLTRYPIVFVGGPRSLFRPFDHWNSIPAFLREHGYEVIVLDPPFRKSLDATSVAHALKELATRAHVIADSSFEEEMEKLARNGREVSTASLTLVRNRVRSSKQAIGNRLEDLKPFETALEVFEIDLLQKDAQFGQGDVAAVLALKLHNLFLGKKAVDALETGEIFTQTPWAVEARFLDLAVMLAERDATTFQPEPR